MKITHQDIIDREFRVKFRGFDMAEVDTFLEEVAEKFFKLTEENNLYKETVSVLQEEIESVERVLASRSPVELPAEMVNLLEELKQDTAAINAEIVAIKQDRSTFASLDKSIKEAVVSLQKAAANPPRTRIEHGNLVETLDKFRKSTETMSGELADLKKEVGSIQQIRDEIKSELHESLKSHFNDLEEILSKAPPVAAQAESKPKTSAPLAAAIIEEEPEGAKEDTMLPSFEELDDAYDDDLEFLSEDDILDVDKLRGVFQSVLDNSVSDTPNSREYDDDSSSDLLFLEDILEDEPEPEVTFSLEEEDAGEKPKKEAEA